MWGVLLNLDMKTTSQTKFSIFFANGDRLTYGNCLVACVASMLDEPIDEVPNIYTFYGLESGEGEEPLWLKVLNLWMGRKHGKNLVIRNEVTPFLGDYVIARGKSVRGRSHCCIYREEEEGLKPFFDPHPTSQFLREINRYYTIEEI